MIHRLRNCSGNNSSLTWSTLRSSPSVISYVFSELKCRVPHEAPYTIRYRKQWCTYTRELLRPFPSCSRRTSELWIRLSTPSFTHYGVASTGIWIRSRDEHAGVNVCAWINFPFLKRGVSKVRVRAGNSISLLARQYNFHCFLSFFLFLLFLFLRKTHFLKRGQVSWSIVHLSIEWFVCLRLTPVNNKEGWYVAWIHVCGRHPMICGVTSETS